MNVNQSNQSFFFCPKKPSYHILDINSRIANAVRPHLSDEERIVMQAILNYNQAHQVNPIDLSRGQNRNPQGYKFEIMNSCGNYGLKLSLLQTQKTVRNLQERVVGLWKEIKKEPSARPSPFLIEESPFQPLKRLCVESDFWTSEMERSLADAILTRQVELESTIRELISKYFKGHTEALKILRNNLYDDRRARTGTFLRDYDATLPFDENLRKDLLCIITSMPVSTLIPIKMIQELRTIRRDFRRTKEDLNSLSAPNSQIATEIMQSIRDRFSQPSQSSGSSAEGVGAAPVLNQLEAQTDEDDALDFFDNPDLVLGVEGNEDALREALIFGDDEDLDSLNNS